MEKKKKQKGVEKDSQSRMHLLTINNPSKSGWTHERIKEVTSNKFATLEYLAIADEIGENGTPHSHVFIATKSAVRFSTIKKYFPEAHIDSVKSTAADCVNYIRKKGKWENDKKAETSIPGTFEEIGTLPPDNKGKNHGMQELYRMIVEEGLSNAEIIRINNDYILQIDKLDKIRTTFLQDKFKGTRRLELQVTYVTGETGKGKSRDILDEYGDENCYRVTDYTHPFDGYTTEPVLVFEEFRNSIAIKDILNYLDVYPVQLAARYANKYACYTRVYICTNWPLERQYKYEQHNDPESYAAFLRRIHHIKIYTEKDIIEYDSVQEYLKKKEDFESIEDSEESDLPFDN